jgi:hypothetical protein
MFLLNTATAAFFLEEVPLLFLATVTLFAKNAAKQILIGKVTHGSVQTVRKILSLLTGSMVSGFALLVTILTAVRRPVYFRLSKGNRGRELRFMFVLSVLQFWITERITTPLRITKNTYQPTLRNRQLAGLRNAKRKLPSAFLTCLRKLL